MVKVLPANAGDTRDAASILGWEDPLEQEKATHSSNLAWKIPWTGETGKLQSMGRKESETSEATWHIHILFNGEVFSSAATLPA